VHPAFIVKNAARSILAATALAWALVACGDGETAGAPAPASMTGAQATEAETMTTSSAPASALERNAAGANRLVGEGARDLKGRLASLRGHPVVVNQWASWCGPCRFEFPFFAAAVRRHGATVAFVGVDYMDTRDAAQSFLEEQPPGFPSIYDGEGRAARAIGGGRAMPTTLFIGPDGRTRYAKLGGYAKASQLDADIRRHLLGAS
jgi:cytochrome c biogenesis protein CcmG/thiol:disulfide interchange protein DsbE